MKPVSAFLNFLVGLLLLAVAPALAAAQLKSVGKTESFLFTGKPGKVQVALENNTAERVKQPLNYRIFQASSATLAPLGERQSLGEMEFPPGQAAIISIPFAPPDVRAITLFVMKVYLGEEAVASMNITAFPPKIFSRLTETGIAEIHLHEPDSLLRPVLEASGVKVTDRATASEAKLLLVRLPNAAAETDWNEQREVTSLPTLFIIGRGVTGSEKLLPTKFLQPEQGGRVAIVQDWFIPDIKENALSQVRLLRAIQILLTPDKESNPAGKKKD